MLIAGVLFVNIVHWQTAAVKIIIFANLFLKSKT